MFKSSSVNPSTVARLAIDGGTPVRDPAASRAMSGWPRFEDDEIEAAAAVLRSGKVNYWTGTQARQFEQEFAATIGVRHAIAVSNGTVALEIVLAALEIGPGCDVVVPSRTFVATASAVMMVGARPVFADVDAQSGNVTVQTVAAAITSATRAVIVVHLGGWPAQMDAIVEVCRARGIAVVEDCAQAVGAAVGSRATGALADAATFSFCQDKIMTTGGEGGMITTNDDTLWSRMWSRKDHGKSWEAVYQRDHAPGFRWLHETLGTNARLTEPQAAIGRVQLRKLGAWTGIRTQHAKRLAERLCGHPAIRMPEPPAGYTHAYYRQYGYVVPDALVSGWNRDRIMEAVTAEGVPCQVGSCAEIYREKLFAGGLAPQAPLPVAHELANTSLALLVHPTLTDDEIDATADALVKVLAVAAL